MINPKRSKLTYKEVYSKLFLPQKVAPQCMCCGVYFRSLCLPLWSSIYTSGSLPTQSLCLAPSSSSLTKLATHRPLDAIFIEELPHTSRLAPNATPAYSFKHSVVSLKAYYNNA